MLAALQSADQLRIGVQPKIPGKSRTVYLPDLALAVLYGGLPRFGRIPEVSAFLKTTRVSTGNEGLT